MEQSMTTGRATKEWIGKTPDSHVPGYVKLRIWRKHEGICHISKRPIRLGERWDVEHVVALCNGGEHRESNLAPALTDPHKQKTKDDLKMKAINDRVTKKHLGIRPKRRTIPGRKFDGTPIPSRWK
jgi:5-methylcytosine-specific restriction enzyme A